MSFEKEDRLGMEYFSFLFDHKIFKSGWYGFFTNNFLKDEECTGKVNKCLIIYQLPDIAIAKSLNSFQSCGGAFYHTTTFLITLTIG